jgi:hypothetical protein
MLVALDGVDIVANTLFPLINNPCFFPSIFFRGVFTVFPGTNILVDLIITKTSPPHT